MRESVRLVLTTDLTTRFAMQIVNGAGHCPHQEFPQVVNRHITKFVKGRVENV